MTVRRTRIDNALSWWGLRWLPSEDVYNFDEDLLEVQGRATIDDLVFIDIEERITAGSYEPYWYQYGLSYISASGEHMRVEVHGHPQGRRKPGDQCSGPYHRHRYVAAAGSPRPHLAPCEFSTIEDALFELLQEVYRDYPPTRPAPLRP